MQLCFPVLEELNLSRTGVTMESLLQVAQQAPPLLAHLTLDSNRLGEYGLTHFVQTELADRLHSLSLHGTGIGDQDMYALADSGRFIHLTRLNLSANLVSDGARVARRRRWRPSNIST